jgi:acetylornithine/N-succinyldiaminopimelate aminotransferase
MTSDNSSTQGLVEAGRDNYMPNYAPKPIVLDHGKGARIWDLDGTEYIDLSTGIAVNAFGHQHPELLDAFMKQGQKLWHASNIYYVEPAVRLAQEIVDSTFAEQVFFCNSGSEAVEAAIKLVRKHASLSFPDTKREIITFEGSFHGRTLAAVTATAQPKYHEGFEPLPGGFSHCSFNDPAAIESMISDRTCAVMVEPVQGEGGITSAQQGFLKHLRALCDKHNALLVFDEIQCGMGRTGKFFAYEWETDVTPDVVTMAKALGGGLPIGALLVGPKAAGALPFGSHGSTFGGNPVVTAVARVALRLAQSPEMLANVKAQGDRFRAFFASINQELGIFSEVRGRGLMIGAELVEKYAGKAGELLDRCTEAGVLALVAGPDVLRLLPPLTITDEETDVAIERLGKALRAWVAA